MLGSHLFRLIQGLSLLTGLSVASSSPAVLHWPNPQLNFIDEVLYGNGRPALAIISQFCAKRQSTTVAAQWLRLAFNDMSTHNVTDGSGGLDASIVYELDRPQNVGEGMLQSLIDFNTFHSPRVSLADAIAIGVVLGLASCGGPVLPYRAGRINATEAGPATVPEPQQDLQTHIASFQNQGFNQTEMISLVACGHTLGGVRSADFPTIVDSSVAFQAFDSTNTFDTNVVTQYLADASVDPLVVTPNVTVQSDLRIFSSDGNVTMQSLSTMDVFNATCGILFERMINTVPKEVRFTDPIEPFENKVVGFSFYTNNGSYVMDVALRRLTPNPSRTVTLYWLPRYNVSYCEFPGCPVNATVAQNSVTTFLGKIKGLGTLTKYLFTAQAPLDVSISKFWFVVDENDGSNATVVDNYGAGYNIEQDTLLYDPVRTKLVAGGAAGSNYTFVVGVRHNTFPLPTVTLTSWERGPSPTFIPIVDTVELQADPNNPPADGYNFFTGNFSNLITAIDVQTTIGEQEYKLYVDNDVFVVGV